MRAKEFTLKHRDPNWKTLQAKRTSNAAGSHLDKKRAKKKGDVKHKKDSIPTEGWSQKYKSSINCSEPKGFSQKAHCAGKKKNDG
jgi:hypothetical protein